MFHNENEDSDQEHEGNRDIVKKVNKHRKLKSVVWETFTVVDRSNHIAVCNICHQKLSFKTTVTNLKKHIVRKHTSVDLPSAVRNRITHQKTTKSYAVHKPKYTELGGLEGLVLNIVGDEGETDQQENQEHYTEEVIDNSAANDSQEEISHFTEHRESRPQHTTNWNEKRKKDRMMDLQLECLEIKKYNMQLEALLLEQQLNIRRSIFTENLAYADTQTRSTQTDVGGEHTRVFYVTDSRGGVATRQLFSMQPID